MTSRAPANVVHMLAVVARDLIGLLGAVAIVRGVYMVSPAAAWVVAGVMMVAVAVLTSRREGRA